MSANSKSGTRIGQFVIQRCLINLSHISVYDAFDLVANHKVILYLSSGLPADEKFAETRLQLPHHPGLLKPFGREQGHDCSFLVMEYFDGLSLEDRLKSGALSLNSAVTITTGIAKALDSIHERGGFFSVLRPSMILVDSNDRVKLLDISIVSPRDGSVGYVATPSDILDSLPYVSPEILLGDSVGAQSDQFTLAVIMCSMFGVTPFHFESPVETLIHICFEDLDGAQLQALPLSLVSSLIRALSKSPAGRFTTCSELASMIENASRQRTGSHTPLDDKSFSLRSHNLPVRPEPAAILPKAESAKATTNPPVSVTEPKKILWMAGGALVAIAIFGAYFMMNGRRAPAVASPSSQAPSSTSDQELLRALQPADVPGAKLPADRTGLPEGGAGAVDRDQSPPNVGESDNPKRRLPASSSKKPTPRKEKAETIEVKPIEPTVVSPQ